MTDSRAHLRWLRSRVPGVRLFAPRVVVLAPAGDGRVRVGRDGEPPSGDLALGTSAVSAARSLAAAAGVSGTARWQPRAVLSGRTLWEEDHELGPLQPIWIVVEPIHESANLVADAAPDARPMAQTRLGPLLAPADGEPRRTALPIGGDYIRALRPHIGTERIFYPWAGLALRDAQGAIFLVRLHQGAQWHCPGGGMEIGETPAQAAERELAEETGLVAHAGRLLGCFTRYQRSFANGDRIQAVAMLYEGQLRSGELRRDKTGEIDAAGWFRESALPPLREPWAGRVRLALTGEGVALD